MYKLIGVRYCFGAITLIVALSIVYTSRLYAEQPVAVETVDTYDVVVYGGTASGIVAAIQVKRMGGSVVVIEPSERIGGLTTGGLGQTDIGNKAAIGGISLEFYQRIRNYYADSSNWKWQKQEEYQNGRAGLADEPMWTFEPSAALTVLEDFVRDHDIPVEYNERLNREKMSAGSHRVKGVVMDGPRIVSVTTESGATFRGRIFIDATYEGDLLAGAGISYTVGRESNATYGETLSGVQTAQAVYHQFQPGVEPYIVAGDPASGLLPGIDPAGPGDEGRADRRVQAYCFRMCLTDAPENRIPFTRSANYDPLHYELLFRNFEAGATMVPWGFSAMPNRKTDVNNRLGFSTDFIGQNYEYPEASYTERDSIIEQHREYQQGLMWTLANHERVPAAIRREVSRWGTCRDEFEREDGWQHQLYIREARRMVGSYVMTQHNCEGQDIAARPIGLAAYTMDSHHVQRYVDANGYVKNEGDVEVGGFSPYPIDYGSLIARSDECTNLLSPVCLSASHMAFGSIRMEPVFMALGQSAGTAAMLAVRGGTTLQDIDYDDLRKQLLQDKQVLRWTGPKKKPPVRIEIDSLPGIVIDESKAIRNGFDVLSRSNGPFIGFGYRHDGNGSKGQQSARFLVVIPKAGRYDVRLAWSAHANRATNVPVTVRHAGGESTLYINQRKKPDHGVFGSVGSFEFDRGETWVEITNTNTDGYVLVDALQFLESADILPNGNQLRYQESQLGCFVHYGPAAYLNSGGGDYLSVPAKDLFNPQKLNTEQWMRAAKAIGAKHIVLTAKHHNGYCLWP
ncbi:MAG TPA: FAD-dependent oxidoreductase, partial [Candidatus Hydrogenedentes bacterium]|nr:FAD-dependent oxidoreductase [Candidatus Hydrogenedentota bacterium]